ncbi:restriction endonuclease subunit S [Brevundimonas halotolerans]|uniref:Type I restriction enzyme S subunit n=1 Tax=Brevundimonas halotolerans TaxID=69670 RepID=A0A7W9A2R1_9CAUL|nr:restriction endonuclease subunit S [Brevundimonas halotolerans]MBB5660371.1 type I restriction enzyme S subunit [Brevundimonas halotolerans]
MISKGKSSAEPIDGATLVPRLRFPEFRTADGWKEISLQKLARPVTDRATTGDADNVLSLSGERGLVLQSDYFGKKIAGDRTDRYLKIRKDDFVYNDRTTKASSFGTIKRLSNYSGGVVSPIYKCFRFQPSENPAFWEWYFESGSHDPALGGLVNEGARAGRFNISVTQFLSTNAWRPDEAEQQKIANCLDSADALIAAQRQKVEALGAHKKGLMQQLFPQEGETQPRLRFPEFEGAGEWKEVRLNSLGDLVSGLTYSPDDVQEEGLLVLRSSNIQGGKIDLKDCVYVDPNIKRANLSRPNDILVCVRNGSTALIGKTALIPEGMPLCTHGAFMTVFRSKTPKFAFQLFQTSRYQKQVAGDLGATINSINGSQFLRYKFFVPKPPEQQRIADCLTSLDDLIAAETRKLDTLKTHKKGLMQQLFPQVGEVGA